MQLIDMIIETARRLGASTHPVRLGELHRAFLAGFSDAKVGQTRDSFDATLNLHCINMRSRFPDPRDVRASAAWLTRPTFKRMARGMYMLLSDEELSWFHAKEKSGDPCLFEVEYDVDKHRANGAISIDAYPFHGGTAESSTVSIGAPARPGMPVSVIESPVVDDRVRDALRAFVLAFAESEDIAYRDEPGRPDLEIPVDVRGPKGSHYLLMAASIDVGTDSNHIRPFLVRLNKQIPGGLFNISLEHEAQVLSTIEACQRDELLRGWQAKKEVPRILAEVNEFVAEKADGDLDDWAKRFTSPRDIVERLARNIHYQGRGAGEARKKMWMFLRWVARPAPDLRLWDHLDPADLMVPVDRHVARVAAAIGLISPEQATAPTRRGVEAITAFARELFPQDPARVDYPFFMWGRGRSNPRLLEDACYCNFERTGARCPLALLLPCGARCG